MRALVKILLGGFVAFMLLAIAQEWRFFASAWFGDDETEAQSLDDADREAAAGAVRETLTLLQHFYASGGDPRFADRLAVSSGVLDEVTADIEYLRRNHRLQDSKLQQLEILSVEPVAAEMVEVQTREFWIHRTLSIDGGEQPDPTRSQVMGSKYFVARQGPNWRVEGWDFEDPVASPARSPELQPDISGPSTEGR